MSDDLYTAPESANGGGALVVVLLLLAMVALAGFNWLVEVVAHAHWGL
jgi:hypothetical protein